MIAWLRIDDTNIHHPVMQGRDNKWYRTHDWQDEYQSMGSIFLDYKNKENFSDDTINIYGNTDSRGLMLSDILKFEDTEYFLSHQSGVIFILGGEIVLEVIAFVDTADLAENTLEEVRKHAKHWSKPEHEGRLIFINTLDKGKTLVCVGYGVKDKDYKCGYCGAYYNNEEVMQEEVHVYEIDREGYHQGYRTEWWCVECAEKHAYKMMSDNGDTYYNYFEK